MTHPLTDEMCEKLQLHIFSQTDEDCMRAAADWQLEQDAKYFAQYLIKHFGFGPEVAEIRAEWFKEDMRPQVVDLPQANSDVCGEEGIERARQQTFEENDELMRKLSDS